MATPIKRIEKDFLLKVLYDEQIPVMYLSDRTEYIFKMEKPAKSEVFFKADRPVVGLKPRKKLEMVFDYKGQVIFFSIEISAVKDQYITAPAPEYLFKNMDRSYSRVTIPQDLKVQFTFHGDRFSLHYPKFRNMKPVILANGRIRLNPEISRDL